MDISTFRWILIVAGIVVLAAIFLLGNPERKRKRRASRKPRKRPATKNRVRREPTLGEGPGVPRVAPAQDRHGIREDCQIDRDISTEEGKVTMGCSDLRAVSVVVHTMQRVQEAPDTGAEEGYRCRTQ